MSLHNVLAKCLVDGTATKEKGKSARIQLKHDDETVLLFKTDSDEVRAYLGIARASDLMFFYMKNHATPVLVFVELKGSDLKKAADQLRVTIQAVRAALKKRVGASANSLKCHAIIVFSGNAPKSLDDLQRSFRDATGISLRTQRDNVDIRSLLT